MANHPEYSGINERKHTRQTDEANSGGREKKLTIRAKDKLTNDMEKDKLRIPYLPVQVLCFPIV